MSTPDALWRRFCEAQRTAGRQPADDSRVDAWQATLARKVVDAQTAWPTLTLEPLEFVSYIGERFEGTLEALAALPSADLYLANACLTGLPAAAVALDAAYLKDLDAALRRSNIPSQVAEDTQQWVRERILTSREGKPALLIRYSGSGALRDWIWMVAIREALRMARRERKEKTVPPTLLELLPSGEDSAELQYMKELYQAEFRVAFVDALRSLSHRERNLLRQQYLQGLSIDQLGGIYRVHRATAARWVERARERLLEETRRGLMSQLQLNATELDSVMRLIQSQLRVSVRRYLR